MTVPHRSHAARPQPDNIAVLVPGVTARQRRSSDQLAARAVRLAVTADGSIDEDAHVLAALAGDDMLRLQQARRRISRADRDGSSAVISHALAALHAAIDLAASGTERST